MQITKSLPQIAKILVGFWITGVIAAIFLILPPYQGLGDAGRIMVLHVPTAWVSVLAFAVSAFYSGIYLGNHNSKDDDRALAAAECGFLFAVIATVTGAIFSQVVWGIYWNWDPRQTSIFVLLLIYAALFALRESLENVDQKRRLSAVFSLFAFITVPFLIFVAPRVAKSTLHPNCALVPGSNCDGISLNEGKIGLLGERKVQLLAFKQQGAIISAKVKVSEPGLRGETELVPTFDLTTGKPLATPSFPGLRYSLTIQQVDLVQKSIHLNIKAPGTGLLENPRTFFTFLAANLGFTALFIWLFQLRALLLSLEWAIGQRESRTI